MNLAGPNATQSGFAVIDVAAGYLASQLIKQLGYTERGLLLQMTPINAIDARMAGWAARCVAKEDN
jgi:hypothetical protein